MIQSICSWRFDWMMRNLNAVARVERRSVHFRVVFGLDVVVVQFAGKGRRVDVVLDEEISLSIDIVPAMAAMSVLPPKRKERSRKKVEQDFADC